MREEGVSSSSTRREEKENTTYSFNGLNSGGGPEAFPTATTKQVNSVSLDIQRGERARQ